jgi:hypothetical protein
MRLRTKTLSANDRPRRLRQIALKGFPIGIYRGMINDREEYEFISQLIDNYLSRRVIDTQDGEFLREYARGEVDT